jgi:hypothetical protein
MLSDDAAQWSRGSWTCCLAKATTPELQALIRSKAATSTSHRTPF